MSLSRLTISDWLIEWCTKAKVDPKFVQFTENSKEVIVYTDRPGWLIGKHGVLIEEAKEALNTICQDHKVEKLTIRLVETIRADYAKTFDPMAFGF